MNQSDLWREYARLHPEEWHDYHGWCGCNWCAEYRRKANEWIREQIAVPREFDA